MNRPNFKLIASPIVTVAMTMSRRHNKGLVRKTWAFTLLELLIVVTILGILAALLLPAISRSKQKAQQIQCVNNLRQLGIALVSFAADNHAYPSYTRGTNSPPGTWETQLAEQGGFPLSKSQQLMEGIWRCPTARFRPSKWIHMSYGYNAFGSEPVGYFGLVDFTHASKSDKFPAVKESDVVNPSDMMAIGESIVGSVNFSRFPEEQLDYLNQGGRATARHQGRINVLFCDGHVESPPLKFVFVDTNDAALARWNRDHQPRH